MDKLYQNNTNGSKWFQITLKPIRNLQNLPISAPGQAFTFTDKYGQVCPEGWKPGGDTIVPEVGPSKEYFQLVYPGEGEEVMEVGTEDGEVMEEGEQLEAADEDSGVGVTSVGSGFTDKIEVSPSDEMIDQVISHLYRYIQKNISDGNEDSLLL